MNKSQHMTANTLRLFKLYIKRGLDAECSFSPLNTGGSFQLICRPKMLWSYLWFNLFQNSRDAKRSEPQIKISFSLILNLLSLYFSSVLADLTFPCSKWETLGLCSLFGSLKCCVSQAMNTGWLLASGLTSWSCCFSSRLSWFQELEVFGRDRSGKLIFSALSDVYLCPRFFFVLGRFWGSGLAFLSRRSPLCGSPINFGDC